MAVGEEGEGEAATRAPKKKDEEQVRLPFLLLIETEQNRSLLSLRAQSSSRLLCIFKPGF